MRFMRVIGACAGVALLVVGIVGLISPSSDPRVIIRDIYDILFGIMAVICELRIRRLLTTHFYFLTHFFGLGMFYCFIGGLALSGSWWTYIIGGILVGVGVIYLMLGLLNQNMDKEDGWTGASKAAQSYAADQAVAAAQNPDVQKAAMSHAASAAQSSNPFE